jgi:hypothetical protein
LPALSLMPIRLNPSTLHFFAGVPIIQATQHPSAPYSISHFKTGTEFTRTTPAEIR